MEALHGKTYRLFPGPEPAPLVEEAQLDAMLAVAYTVPAAPLGPPCDPAQVQASWNPPRSTGALRRLAAAPGIERIAECLHLPVADIYGVTDSTKCFTRSRSAAR